MKGVGSRLPIARGRNGNRGRWGVRQKQDHLKKSVDRALDEVGVRCVAAPILGASQEVVAVVGLACVSILPCANRRGIRPVGEADGYRLVEAVGPSDRGDVDRLTLNPFPSYMPMYRIFRVYT